MKTQHKNIFKAGLQLVAALLATVFSFLQGVLRYFFSSNQNEEEDTNFRIEIEDGFLVSKGDNFTLPLEELDRK